MRAFPLCFYRWGGGGGSDGCSNNNSKLGVFRWDIFFQRSHSVRRLKRGSQMVRIRQILANFPGKLQMWTHFWQNFYKTIENFDEMLSKKGVIRWEIVKNCMWISKKKVIGWEWVEKRGQWVRASWKNGVNVATHPHYQFLASSCPLQAF